MSTTARSVLGADLPLAGDDVSFRSVHDPESRLTFTVISSSSDGAWPVTRRLDELLTL
jgi:hypothetical protein